ncbi:MAG: 5'-deoxynucleotidase [Gammaproteobacteria bacterium]|nr:MAG: 5'-deoxynucleotidase [Gammaproteobacteria bacterium]
MAKGSRTSLFFAYLERLRWIRRWGLKRNVVEENVMEHSWQVATIAHTLALIARARHGMDVDPGEVAITALYHDVSEIITGDLPTPVKYHSENIRTAYKAIEKEAEKELLGTLPDYLQPAFQSYLLSDHIPADTERYVKAADLISAFLKCRMETQAGNHEFEDAIRDVEQRIRALNFPPAETFLAEFVDGFLLTLDELLRQHDQQI